MPGGIQHNPARDLSAQAGARSDCLAPNFHNAVSDPSAILAKGQQPFRDDLTDQPGLIALIGINGGVEPFHFIDFRSLHGGSYGD